MRYHFLNHSMIKTKSHFSTQCGSLYSKSENRQQHIPNVKKQSRTMRELSQFFNDSIFFMLSVLERKKTLILSGISTTRLKWFMDFRLFVGWVFCLFVCLFFVVVVFLLFFFPLSVSRF